MATLETNVDRDEALLEQYRSHLAQLILEEEKLAKVVEGRRMKVGLRETQRRLALAERVPLPPSDAPRPFDSIITFGRTTPKKWSILHILTPQLSVVNDHERNCIVSPLLPTCRLLHLPNQLLIHLPLNRHPLIFDRILLVTSLTIPPNENEPPLPHGLFPCLVYIK